MKIKHQKKYYVGGLISLLILPVLFFVATIGTRSKAIHYGSILVENTFLEDYKFSYISGKSVYDFEGVDEPAKLLNFQQYFYTHKHTPSEFYKLTLPNNCSYNFFIQIADILHRNKCIFGVSHKTIVFTYAPEFTYEQEYQPASTSEEYEYVRSEISKIVSTIKEYISGEPIQRERIIKYSDLGYFPYGSIYFPPNSVIKDEPRSSLYFRTIGIWFIPIISLWLLLFILSIKRNRKLLPNQALKLLCKKSICR